MKILIVSQYYFPEQFQINDIAPELVKRGHDVTVLTGYPNYPKGEFFEGYENFDRTEETINGVKIKRVKIKPRKSGPLNLLLNYFSYYKNATKFAKKTNEKYDIVLCYQLSPVTIAGPAIAYAKKHKVPLLLYCLDIWPESAQAYIKSGKGPLYALISSFSKKMYKQCDRIAVTSRPFIDYLNEKNGVSIDKMIYIPQHADSSYLDMDLSSEENGINDFMYAGNIGNGQVIENIVKAVAEIKDREDFIVHIVGDGSRRVCVEELVKELGVEDKFVFYGNRSRDEMAMFYKRADALLLTLRGNNFVGNTMPGKLQVYMTTGKPIFAAINGAANEVITEAKCGECVGAGDFLGLAKLMTNYMDDPEKYDGCGENAKAYFKEHFTLDTYVDKLEENLKSMVG